MTVAEDIRQLTGDVLATAFGLPLTLSTREAWSPDLQYVSGLVTIHGSWTGFVGVHCSKELARRFTATVFSVDPAKTTSDDISDVLRELANIVGGNIKSVLPGPSKLSLPTADMVERPALRVNGVTVWLEYGGQPMFVEVDSSNETDARRARGED